MGSVKKQPDLSLFKQIGNQHEGVLFVFDHSVGQFIYLNQAFESVWMKTVEEIMAHPAALLDTIHPEDTNYVKDNYKKFLAEPEKMQVQFRIVWPYTDDRWIQMNVFPLEQSHLVAGQAEDVSGRVKNIFNLQKYNARKDSMLEILSHDLRGPIAMVQSLAAMLEEDLPKYVEDEKGKEHINMLQMIQKVCKRNINLIRDLVHNEFLESTEAEVNKERLDLVWEINEVIDIYRNAQENLSKVFELTSSQERVFAQIDSLKFMQVINNLVSNAIKFTHENGLIRIHIEKKKDIILITVSDNGVGIPQKNQPFLFDKFTKARRPGLKGEESIGLGMSIIKVIVEMHDGKVWFESEENKGSTFYIQLSTDE